MKLIKISHSSFLSSLAFSFYLYGWNPLKKQCLCVYKDSIKYGTTCNQVLKINTIPITSEWYLSFLPQIADRYNVQLKDLSVSQVTLKQAPVPLVIFPLDLNISFSFYVKSRFVLCVVECTNDVCEFSLDNIHYLFNLNHRRSSMTNADHYHYTFLKTLGRENIATFYNLENDLQVWEWFQLRFNDIFLKETPYFCPRIGFDLVIEEIYQRTTDPFPVLARVKEYRTLPKRPQDYIIVMRAPLYICTHLDVGWWFSKEKFVLVLSINQSPKVKVPHNESWKVETLRLNPNFKNVTMNKFQYHCLQHLLQLDDLSKITPLKNFDIEGYYSINVFKPYATLH